MTNFFVREAAADLKLFTDGHAPVRIPVNYRSLSLKDLDDRGLFVALANCYRDIYGSDETDKDGRVIWGEGAYCDREGLSKTITINEYLKRFGSCDLTCECGGKFILYYPDEVLRETLRFELSPGSHGENPFLALLTDGSDSVGGFAWGAICSTQSLNTRLRETRFKNSNLDTLSKVDMLSDILERDGYREFVFFDELAVESKSRIGFAPVQFLGRIGFEHAIPYTNTCVYWTSTRSPIFKITTLLGYQPVFEIDGLIFLVNPDLSSLLKLLQNKQPEGMQAIMVRNLRKLRYT